MKKPIELDGRTGEGGGQVVRLAVGLAALTSQALSITHVRGNREGARGGGLKSQHVTAIKFLAEATDADVEGLSVGSKTLLFAPRRPPTDLLQRNIKISADTGAASTLLIFQAIFPFLLFAGNENGDPIEVDISGGTNVSYSLSFEYLDQILLPTLHDFFGINVERSLQRRGWSLGPSSRGSINVKFTPLSPGEKLRFRQKRDVDLQKGESNKWRQIDVSLVVPRHAFELLQSFTVKDIGDLFPDVDIRFKTIEDSGHDARWYVLLVAHSATGIRLGRDILWSMPKKTKSPKTFISQLSSKVCRDLFEETSINGAVDEHLEDQLVVFQAMCEGYSSFPRSESVNESSNALIDALGNLNIGDSRLRKEKNHEPFGHGSMHSKTARWVASELLPKTQFFNRGDIVQGVGVCLSQEET